MLGRSRIALTQVTLAASASASLPTVHSYFEARWDPRLPAVLSIQRHLEEVETRLRAYPPAGLDAGQSAARAARLEDLRAYRLRGDFPQNLDFPDRVLPYFIDARGVACAVGHLMLLSGGGDLAKEVARTRNHAYIPELDDPRLAEWARRNGLTLEECARIQPSYAPLHSDIVGLDLDTRGRPWVVTGRGMGRPGYPLSYRGEPGWTSFPYTAPDSFVRLCLVGENPLVLQGTGFSWKGGPETAPEGEPMQMTACAASGDGKSFWLGGSRGARRYAVEGSDSLRLVATVRKGFGAMPTDTVTHLAQAGSKTWIGTRQGMLYGEYPALGFMSVATTRLSGLLPGTDQTGVWFGLQGEGADLYQSHYFSLIGILWHDGHAGPRRYDSDNSPLPCDAVLKAAPGPGKSIWFTCDGKQLHRFIPPDRLETAAFELPRAATTLKSDALGRLYIGTYAPGIGGSSAQGLFRVTEGGLEPLGYPGAPSALARPRRSGGLHPSGPRRNLGLGGEAQGGSDVLGRRTGSLIATGITVPESARRE